MNVRAVLNPRAGLGARSALDALHSVPRAWGAVDVHHTRAPGHAEELARDAAAAGCDLVLAVGGDGTVNEVAAGLIGTPTTLGLVPAGSGNGLARTLGIPLRPRAAVAALASGVSKAMDVGRLNGRPFLNVAGAGFDADVGAAYHTRGRAGGRRGVAPYVLLGLARLFRYRAPAVRLEAGALSYDGRALLVAILNGRQYGAGAMMAPRAHLDDGLLDVLLFEAASPFEVLLQMPRLFAGRIGRYRRCRQAASARVRLESPAPVAVHRDGEPGEPVPKIDVHVEPAALRVLVPASVAADPQGPFTCRDTSPAG